MLRQIANAPNLHPTHSFATSWWAWPRVHEGRSGVQLRYLSDVPRWAPRYRGNGQNTGSLCVFGNATVPFFHFSFCQFRFSFRLNSAWISFSYLLLSFFVVPFLFCLFAGLSSTKEGGRLELAAISCQTATRLGNPFLELTKYLSGPSGPTYPKGPEKVKRLIRGLNKGLSWDFLGTPDFKYKAHMHPHTHTHARTHVHTHTHNLRSVCQDLGNKICHPRAQTEMATRMLGLVDTAAALCCYSAYMAIQQLQIFQHKRPKARKNTTEQSGLDPKLQEKYRCIRTG